MSIDCAFFGFLTADAEPRVSAAGKNWVRLRAGVGKDDAVQWVQIAAFGKAVETAADLKKADRIYVEGAIRVANWTSSDGIERYGLSVTAFRCERTHNIGRNRKKQKPTRDRSPVDKATTPAPAESSAPLNDEIPF